MNQSTKQIQKFKLRAFSIIKLEEQWLDGKQKSQILLFQYWTNYHKIISHFGVTNNILADCTVYIYISNTKGQKQNDKIWGEHPLTF